MIIKIENKSVHASDAGQGVDSSKDTIVFLHGSGLSHIVWSLTEQFFSSKKFKRGFCSNCGSSLFFQSRSSNEEIAISSGSLNSKVPVKGHIFYKDKKSNLLFPKIHKKFSQSAQGFFDKFIYKIK